VSSQISYATALEPDIKIRFKSCVLQFVIFLNLYYNRMFYFGELHGVRKTLYNGILFGGENTLVKNHHPKNASHSGIRN
jgi:hypothetical protein